MNYFKKMKKKAKGKKAETLRKKIVTAGELFIAGALLTAGGNMVDSLSEDSSSPQIIQEKSIGLKTKPRH